MIAEGARHLHLTDVDRETARRRVPPPPPRDAVVVTKPRQNLQPSEEELSLLVVDARWRLQGMQRIVGKPLEGWVLRNRMNCASVSRPLWPPDLARVVAADVPQPRRLACPPVTAPFSVLLADVEHDVHEALRRIFREEARHVTRRGPEEAAELALAAPFHVVACSAKAALHPRSILDGVAREDPVGANKLLVLAPSRDVPCVKHRLEQMGRANRVLALPIDDTTLAHEIFRDHPNLAAREAMAAIAIADVPSFPAFVSTSPRPRFRRLAAAGQDTSANVALASSPMDAFEHVISLPVDLLVVSATMRGDGGEPFYRVLWRLKPEVKGRCVLVVAPDAVAASAAASSPQSGPPRILQRPLTREAIARVVDAFARQA